MQASYELYKGIFRGFRLTLYEAGVNTLCVLCEVSSFVNLYISIVISGYQIIIIIITGWQPIA